MAEIVNLRTARKRAKRQQAEQVAAENRLVHARSKAEQSLDHARQEKTRRDLERLRIERGGDR
jgi:hypothetical protein